MRDSNVSLNDENFIFKNSMYIPKRTQRVEEDTDNSEEKEINLETSNIENSINLNEKKQDVNFSSITNHEKEKDEQNIKKKKQQGNILINSSFLEKKKNKVFYVKIDKEKSDKEGHIVYEISLIIYNQKKEIDKNILCYRRYNNFNTFYNILKIRYPHFIFPKLSPKNSAKTLGTNITSKVLTTKIYNNEAFLEQRRNELQYFINEVRNHPYIGKGDEIKKFLYDATFDEQYFNSLGNYFDYPECMKKINNAGIINQGMKCVTNIFNYYTGRKSTDKNERKIEKKISEIEQKVTNNIEKYKSTFNEIKTIYECLKEEKKEKEFLCNNLLYLKSENIHKENNLDKKKFNELIEINQEFKNDYYKEYLNFFENEILYCLDFCILDIKGEIKAIQRYKTFMENYNKIISYKKQNKECNEILEEQTKIKKDIDIYEETLVREIENIEEKYTKIFKDIIHKLSIYLKNSVEIIVRKYENSQVVK